MVKISDVELPVVFKNQLLFKSGQWNHKSFSNEMVERSVSNTKWSKLNQRLYFKHANEHNLNEWNGKVENIKTVVNNGNIEVRGDVALWDADRAIKVLYGDEPIAVSADIEYNDAGIMFFTGFALEYDPGVRTNEMFLSDSVKAELDGYFHARFSNALEKPQENKIENTEPIPVDNKKENLDENQSAERRLEEDKQETNMVSEKESKSEPQTAQEQKASEMIKQMDEMMKKDKNLLEVPKEQPVETKPVIVTPEVKVEEKPVEVKAAENRQTETDKQLNTPVPENTKLDDKMVDTLVERISEKLKPSVVPLTVHEFGSEKDGDEEVADRLVESLAKM